MPGPRQPTDLVVLNGRKHLTKAETEARRAAEVKAPPPKSKRVKPPAYLPESLHKKFRTLAKQLIEIGILAEIDYDCLARYHKLMESRRIAYGNAYALIWRDRWGVPVELIPIAPGYMQPYLDDNGRLWYVGTNPRTGEYRKFWPTDILHYKAFSTDGLEGVSYLRRGAETIEAALQAQKYEAGFYKNGAKLTGILYTETDLTSRPEIAQPDGTKISIKDAIRREWEHLYTGADNAYRTAVLDYGLKYTPITTSNRDAQFIESKAASIEDVGRLFNIPLYKLGVGKQTYASNVQAAIEYMQRTLSPIVSEHEQEDTYKLLLESEQRSGLQLRRNMMGELRGDWASRSAWFKNMNEIGVYSVNDICELEDRPDVPGGDRRKASLNYVPLDLWAELSVQRANKDGGNQGGENNR